MLTGETITTVSKIATGIYTGVQFMHMSVYPVCKEFLELLLNLCNTFS
jgi:hypothetical protein